MLLGFQGVRKSSNHSSGRKKPERAGRKYMITQITQIDRRITRSKIGQLSTEKLIVYLKKQCILTFTIMAKTDCLLPAHTFILTSGL